MSNGQAGEPSVGPAAHLWHFAATLTNMYQPSIPASTRDSIAAHAGLLHREASILPSIGIAWPRRIRFLNVALTFAPCHDVLS